MGEKEHKCINIFMFTGAYRKEMKLKEAVRVGAYVSFQQRVMNCGA